MKTNLFLRSLFILFCFTFSATYPQEKFIVDLNHRSDDLFHVTLYPDNLSQGNNIFQFAATAPGTYEAMDIGRFVRSFKAFNMKGEEIQSENISVNQWKLYDPAKVKKIEYTVEDTWDSKIDTERIYNMCGSNIDSNNVLINGQCVFGYFSGLQTHPIEIKIEYPSNWQIGTALKLNSDGFYYSPTFDYLVDSPILLGDLTVDSAKIGKTKIKIYTYSKTGLVKSKDLLYSIQDILQAESKFTNGLPVDHYTFLFHLGDYSDGAWEHSYSSEYVLYEAPLTKGYVNSLREMIAHEFFHIVTPLNIHSELIEKFNFVKPIMSRHLWLYEGVTEWAANILQLRDSLISLKDYLSILHDKIAFMQKFKKNISLTELGIHSVEMEDQYINIYNKGAITAGLLDIRLLQLSKGTKGLREVINELSKKYGPEKSFSEENFFKEFVSMTYPEIENFINDYIQGTKELPIKEYYDKIGIDFYESKGLDTTKANLGFALGFQNNNFIISEVSEHSPNLNKLKPGDVLDSLEGEKLTIKNIRKKFEEYQSKKIGDSVDVVVLRNDQKINLHLTFGPSEMKYVFQINSNPTAEQLSLRKIWMKNI